MSARAERPAPDVDVCGRGTLMATVAGALLATVAMNDAAWGDPANLAILGLGGLFLVLIVAVGDRLPRLSHPARGGYFLLQLVLAAAIVAIQARLGSFGMAWIVLMPLVVQANLVWPWPPVAAVSAAALALPVGHAYFLVGPGAAAEAAIGIGALLAFVLLFSAATLRERRARARSDELSRELAGANARLGELYAAADELAASRERNRLAREIHDTLGHTLTVINVQLESARVLIAERPAEAAVRVERAAGLAREGLAEVRRSVAALRSDPLGGGTLAEALARLADEARAGGLASEVDVRGTPRELAPEVALALYRAAQEGLTNVRKHAAARTARLRLDFGAGGRVVLAVEDDGRGCDRPGEGFGLLGLRERARSLGGELSVDGRPGAGLRLTVEVPG